MRGRRALAVILASMVALALMATAVLAGVGQAKDYFEDPNYVGGSGWNGSWTEVNDGGSSSTGSIQAVSSGCDGSSCVQFSSILSVAVGLQRSADFSDANSLTLSFRYRKSGVLGDLEVHAGTSASSLVRVQTLGNSSSYQTVSIPITNYASATTTIMFWSTIGLATSAYIDKVEINATYPTTTTTTTSTTTTTTASTTTTTEPIVTIPTVTLPTLPPGSTTTTTGGSSTTTSPPGASTSTTSTTVAGAPDPGNPPPGGGADDPGPVTPPLTEEEAAIAADNNVVVNLAAGLDLGGFGSGAGSRINPLTGLWVNLNTTVEAISNEILSAIALGAVITFFGLRRIKDDGPFQEPEDQDSRS